MASTLWVSDYGAAAVASHIGRDRSNPKAGPAWRPLRAWPYLTVAAFLLLAAYPFFGYGVGFGPSGAVFGVLLVAPLAVVWWRPVIGWVVSLVPLIFLVPIDRPFVQDPLIPFVWLAFQLASQLPVIYAVAQSPRRPVAYVLPAITLAAGFIAPYGSEFGYGPVTSAASIWVPSVGLAVVLARLVMLTRVLMHRRGSRVRLARMVEHGQVLEEREHRRVLEERARIARELHDLVANHMSVIAVQASTAPYRLEPGRPEVDREFRAIAASARETLQELRQVLTVLRGAPGSAVHELKDVPKLIESARLAGVPVQSFIRGSGAALAPEVQFTAYRIVQEALSNVIKHAPGAATTVSS